VFDAVPDVTGVCDGVLSMDDCGIFGGSNTFEACEGESGIQNYINDPDAYKATCPQMDGDGTCNVIDYAYEFSTGCSNSSCDKVGGFICPWPGCECAIDFGDCCIANGCTSSQCQGGQCDLPDPPVEEHASFIDSCYECSDGNDDTPEFFTEHGQRSGHEDCLGNCPDCADYGDCGGHGQLPRQSSWPDRCPCSVKNSGVSSFPSLHS
jgi:hypothetical protein